MIENSKNLLQIITNKPNLVTGFRMVLNLAAVSLFNQYSVLSAAFILLSTILDYFDGVVARKY
jgi:phosphatidylglycerophosphate synthase